MSVRAPLNIIRAARLSSRAPFHILLSAWLLGSALQAGQEASASKKWLDEDVAYIITPRERQVFEKLQTPREKEIFIEAFWKQRDPTPGTPENEFKEEHYRRLDYANRHFGRQSPLPGWKTDRGRIYIILGEPNDIQHFDNTAQTYPAEVWFYQGETEAGLPPAFNIVFFKEHGSGDYKLYSPTRDGPQALLAVQQAGAGNTAAAFRKLKELEPSLALVSLSLIPGEQSAYFARPSLSSDLLIQQVESSPAKLVRDAYAEKLLRYKDVIDVEYSANYMDSDSLVKVLRASPGLYCVHYSIEPATLSVNQYGSKYSTTLSLNGILKDPSGKVIHQFDKTFTLNFDEAEIERIRKQPYAVYDVFPVIPGTFELSVMLKNEVSKAFTSLERTIVVPPEGSGTWLTPLILGYQATTAKTGDDKLRPFRLGDVDVLAQAGRVFLRSDRLVLAFQVLGLPHDRQSEAEIHYGIFRDSETVSSFVRGAAQYPGFPNVVEPVALSGFPPAHYRVRVAVRIGGREIAASEDEFDLTSQEKMPRPWIYSRFLPGLDDPLYGFLIGNELYNTGKYAEARARLEEAFKKKPDSLDFAFALARTDMALEDSAQAEARLLPFLNAAPPPHQEFFLLLASACSKTGHSEKAVKVLEQGISLHGVSTGFLNLLGECHLRLRNREEARKAWAKSLELNPDQPDVRRALAGLERR
jgi:GWxTD domain-containing protein